jgi:hypothetical protein
MSRTVSVHCGKLVFSFGLVLLAVGLFLELAGSRTGSEAVCNAIYIFGGLSCVAGLLLWRWKRSVARRTVFRIVAASSSFVVAVVLLEVASALVYSRLDLEIGKSNVRAFTGVEFQQETLKWAMHPHMLYVNNPAYRDEQGRKQHTSQGYRGSREIDIEKPANTLRILVLGGSTTYGTGVDQPELAWPHKLEERLRAMCQGAELSVDVEVVNAGLPWATSAELLSHYLYRHRYLKPDLVLIHTGGNDCDPMLEDRYNSEYTHWRPGWGGFTHAPRKGERTLLRLSHTARLAYARWTNDAVATPTLSTRRDLASPPAVYEYRASTNEPVGFRRNLELLFRNIQSDGARVLLFPFVMAQDTTVLSEQARNEILRLHGERHSGMKIALEKNLAVMREIARQKNIPIVELDWKQIPLEEFVDHTHLKEPGHAIKADVLADEVFRLVTDERGIATGSFSERGEP